MTHPKKHLPGYVTIQQHEAVLEHVKELSRQLSERAKELQAARRKLEFVELDLRAERTAMQVLARRRSYGVAYGHGWVV